MTPPRFEAKPKTRVISREEFDKGWDVYCNKKIMRVGYLKVAQYGDGRVIVLEPEWRPL